MTQLSDFIRCEHKPAVARLELALAEARAELLFMTEERDALSKTLAGEDTEAAGFVRHLETFFPISEGAKPILERELSRYLQRVRMDLDGK